MVMGFGPPEGDAEVRLALARAAGRGAMTFALPGTSGSYAIPAADADAFVHQELIEILYHTLWETVHVFFEHRELGHEVGAAGFLYPFLGREKQAPSDLEAQVASSILMKVADDAALRAQVARRDERDAIGDATRRHPRPAAPGRQAHHLRQRRLGHRRQRLGHRLRRAARGHAPRAGRVAVASSRRR